MTTSECGDCDDQISDDCEPSHHTMVNPQTKQRTSPQPPSPTKQHAFQKLLRSSSPQNVSSQFTHSTQPTQPSQPSQSTQPTQPSMQPTQLQPPMQPTQPTPDSLVVHPLVLEICDADELDELRECIGQFPKFQSTFTNLDEIVHALKVIHLYQPNQKFSTLSGIHIQMEPTFDRTSWMEWCKKWKTPLCVKRWMLGEDRNTNLKILKCIFTSAFLMIQNTYNKSKSPTCSNTSSPLSSFVCQMKTQQTISRLMESITQALESFRHLIITYAGDANTCARIEMICEKVKDKLELIRRTQANETSATLTTTPCSTRSENSFHHSHHNLPADDDFGL
jgi:hypothetical protein